MPQSQLIIIFVSRPEKNGTMEGLGGGKRNAQLTLPPPPKHCPVCMIAERPPSAALGRPACVRVVCDPGAMCFRHCMGYMCAGSFCVVRPASSINIRRFLSAIDRRLAMTHPAVPPATHTSSQSEENEERVDGAPPAIMISYSSLIVMADDIVSLL